MQEKNKYGINIANKYKQNNIKTKESEEKKMRKNKGITLIALVITIIVLLILAGVSIATLLGENGILSQAQRAKEETKTATVEEQRKLAISEAVANLEDTEFQGITIPAGMAPTRIEGESTVGEGLVVIDKNGNEWVWIEVPRTKMPENLTFEDEEDYNALTKALKEYAAPYTKGGPKDYVGDLDFDNWTDEWYEGCGLTPDEYKETYQKMLKSVYANGGFCIGRYEAGIEGSTGTNQASLDLARTKSSARIDIASSPKAICQKDAIPYNCIYYSEAQKLASQMTPNSTKTSSAPFGIQMDLVYKFIEEKEVAKQGINKKDDIIASINTDSESWGNYKNQTIEINSKNAKQYININAKWVASTDTKPTNSEVLLSTGASEKTKRLNIYDLAGNEFERTLEKTSADDGPCSGRGGTYAFESYNWPASVHGSDPLNRAYFNASFRPALY